MSTNLNQIDELRKRANVSYTDAKEALENCNGDILEAIVYLEKNKKTQTSKTGIFDRIGELIRKGNSTRLIMYKQDRTIFNISVNIAVLIALIALPFIELIAIGFLIALFTGHRFKLKSSSADTSSINKTFDKISNAVDHMKENISKENIENTDAKNE